MCKIKPIMLSINTVFDGHDDFLHPTANSMLKYVADDDDNSQNKFKHYPVRILKRENTSLLNVL